MIASYEAIILIIGLMLSRFLRVGMGMILKKLGHSPCSS